MKQRFSTLHCHESLTKVAPTFGALGSGGRGRLLRGKGHTTLLRHYCSAGKGAGLKQPCALHHLHTGVTPRAMTTPLPQNRAFDDEFEPRRMHQPAGRWVGRP
jgi:hypothetical protein